MWNYIWPLGLVILSNVFYQICAKSVPEAMNPFVALTVTYGVATVLSLLCFFILGKGTELAAEYKKLNWAPFVLGIVIIGLEVGWIYAYQAGWQVSTGFIVEAAILAVFLIFVGYFLYHEPISWKKLLGVAVCLGGLYLINMK